MTRFWFRALAASLVTVLLGGLVYMFLVGRTGTGSLRGDGATRNATAPVSSGAPAAVSVPAEFSVRDAPRPESLFAVGELVEAHQTPVGADHRFQRVRVVKTTFKYPFLRLEETIKRDRGTGRETVVARTEMVADHIMVKLRRGATVEHLRALALKHGARIRRAMRAPGMYLVELSAPGVDAVATAVARFQADGDVVAYAEPDYLVHAALTLPDDPSFSQLYGMHNTGQTGGTADADIDAPEAWDITTGSAAILVGVIDTGADFDHPDLAPNLWGNPGETGLDGSGNDRRSNGIDDDGNGLVDDHRGWDFANDDNDPSDDHSHGSHVSGTVGASGNNGTGVAGVCWDVSIVPLKFLGAGGTGATSDGIDAVYYATSIGVNLTCNSWGGGPYAQGLTDAIEDAHANGILFMAAAGNSNQDNDVSPHYPSSYTNANIIAVAGTDHNDGKASLSNYGAVSVDLAAPGVNIYSTVPGGGYGNKTGTSMATPHVAGVAALLWGVNPHASHTEIRDAILGGVDPVASMAGITVTGGRLNALQSLVQLGMQVAASHPGEGDVVPTAPVEFALDFTAEYSRESVEPADLHVNGVPAQSVAFPDSDTLVFQYASSPVGEEGEQSLFMAEDALTRLSDGDGVSEWSATFRFDTLPTQVVSTEPPDGSSVLLPITALTVHLNEPYAPASVEATDLILNRGRVSSVELDDEDSITFVLEGIVEEGPLEVEIPAGALTDTYGNPGLRYQGVLVGDVAEMNYPATFAPQKPFGSLVYDPEVAAAIAVPGDADTFTVGLDSGQTVTVVVRPDEGLRPALEVRDPAGVVLDAAQAPGEGEDAVVRVAPAAAAGIYKVSVSGTALTTGNYTLQVLLNADVEMEEHGGSSNDTRPEAQDINASFINLVASASRGAVLGRLPPASGQPVFAEDFESGLLGPSWSVYSSDASGQIRVTPTYGAAQGANALVMDRTPSGDHTLNEAVWTLDLSGVSQPTLRFAHGEWNDEETTFAGAFVGHFEADGVAISDTGTNWYPVWDAPAQPFGTWHEHSIDLAVAATQAGMTLGPGFQIKFQQVDNFPLTTDGRGWDDIVVAVPEVTEDWYRFDLSADETVTVVAKSLASGGIEVALFDGAGLLVADGQDGGAALDQVIQNVRVPAGGAYYVRVTGSGEYSLLVNRNADFDVETNDDLSAIQDISQAGAVLGFVDEPDPGLSAGASTISLPTNLYDVDAYLWDIQQDGRINNGTIDAFDGGLDLLDFPSLAHAGIEDGNREVVIGPAGISEVSVTRKVYVPADRAFARFLEVVTNIHSQQVDHVVRIDTNLGSDSATEIVGTSSGDTTFGVEDDWIVTDDADNSGDPTIVHVIAGEGAERPAYVAAPSGLVQYEYVLTLQPGETRIIMHFAAQNPDRASALAKAERLAELQLEALGGMTSEEKGQVANFQVSDPGDFYGVTATAGENLNVMTLTPADGPYDFENLLDPAVELFSPSGVLVGSDDNSGPDGRNVFLNHVAATSGVYAVRIFAASGRGEYVLGVNVRPIQLVLPERGNENSVLVGEASVAVVEAPESNLVVMLVSDDPGEVVVPVSVTIPAGETNATFHLWFPDDGLLDGSQTARIIASAPGFASGVGDVVVDDLATAVLSVSLPAAAAEGDGMLEGQGLLHVSSNVADDVVIDLVSDDPTELLVPATIVIPAGATSTVFDVTVVDDAEIDDTRQAHVTASVANWTDGMAVMDIADNEDKLLRLHVPAAAAERDGVLTHAGLAGLSGTLPTDLLVLLASDDVSEAAVPVAVTIPAGQTSTTFNVSIINDDEEDGAQDVTVTAEAPGFTGATADMRITDDDVHRFVWHAIPSPQVSGVDFAATISARTIDGQSANGFTGQVDLSAIGAGGAVSVAPTTVGPFEDGAWDGVLTVHSPDVGVTLTAADGAGHSGQSNPFDVEPLVAGFTAMPSTLAGVTNGSVAWGDFDHDEDLDILLTGSGGGPSVTYIYRNDGSNGYTLADTTLPGVVGGTAVWGDYDADGDLDVLLTGRNGLAPFTRLYRNDLAPGDGPPQDSLLLHYDFENSEDGLVPDLSGNGHTGVVYGSTHTSNGYRGAAYHYDGEDDHILAGDLGYVGTGTISFWMSADAIEDDRNPFSTDYASWDDCIRFEVSTGGLFFVGIGFGHDKVYTASLQPSNWYNVVYAWDTTNSWGYLDGEFKFVLPHAGVYPPGANLNFNNVALGNGYSTAPSRYWKGLLDEVRIYGRVLSSNEVGALHEHHPATAEKADEQNDAVATFTDSGISLPGLEDSTAAWADADGDGDLDLLLAGRVGPSRMTRLMVNQASEGGEGFVEERVGLPGVSGGSLDWGDADNDGDPDILITGDTGESWIAGVYRNDDGDFSDVSTPLLGIANGSAVWGDYDADGDLDVLLAGDAGDVPVSLIYRNDGNDDFVNIGAGLVGLTGSSVDWGDYDNDGDLDALLTGHSGSVPVTKVYRNDGADTFTDLGGFPVGVGDSASAWGDADEDGDLDILLCGASASGPATAIFMNNIPPPNAKPSPPAILTSSVSNNTVQLSWNAGADGETPAPGLTYNVRVGPESGGKDILGPMANLATGYRRVPGPGNAGPTLGLDLVDLPAGHHQWGVQSVDGAFAGSAFATASFRIPDTLRVVLPELATEGDGVLGGQGFVSVTIPAESNLVVHLASGDTTEATVLNQVVLPAGQTSVVFDVTVIDDSDQDGAQWVSISANASDTIGGSADIVVADNELHSFAWDEIPSPQTRGVGFPVRLQARAIDEAVILNHEGAASLSGAGVGGPVVVSPAATDGFARGVWTGRVTVVGIGEDVVLTAQDGSGATGHSEPFNVQGPICAVSPSQLSGTVVPAGTALDRFLVVTNSGNTDLFFALMNPTADWLSVQPQTGSVSPGEHAVITTTLDAADFAPGEAPGSTLTVLCNDAVTPTNLVPVSMHVLGADLVITSAVSPSVVKLGGTFGVEFDLLNQGVLPATNSTVAFYLSADTLADPADYLFENVGRAPVLQPGETWFASVPLTMPGPGAWGPGPFHILAMVDDGDEVLEGDGETNNLTATGLAEVILPDILSLAVHPLGYPDHPSVPLGLDIPFIAVANLEFGYTNDVTAVAAWSSSDSNVLAFAATPPGLGGAVSRGTSLVSAVYQGVQSATQTVTVVDPVVTNLAVRPGMVADLHTGQAQSFVLVREYSDRTESEVPADAWFSTAPEVGSMDLSGQFHAVGAGRALVYAVSAGATSDTASVDVLARITGTVTGNGLPLAGAWVSTVIAGSNAVASLTNPDGSYQLSWLPAGTYDVRVAHPDYLTDVVVSVTLGPDRSGADFALVAPRVQVTPAALTNVLVTAGCVTNRQLLVQNNGSADLDFAIGGEVSGVDATETFGNAGTSWTGTLRDRGNVFRATRSALLDEVEMWLNVTAPAELRFFVYEGSGLAGPYHRVAEVAIGGAGPGEGWFSSGPLSVLMCPGRYYYIGAAWDGNIGYSRGGSSPAQTLFGYLESGVPTTVAGYPPADEVVMDAQPGQVPPYRQQLHFQFNPVASPMWAWPTTGRVPPGESSPIDVFFDAAGLLAGEHIEFDLHLTGNDPASPVRTVPLAMWTVPWAPSILPEPPYTLGDSNTIFWTSVPGSDVYQAEQKPEGDVPLTSESIWTVANQVTFAPLSDGMAYSYRTRAAVNTPAGQLPGDWSAWVTSRQLSEAGDWDEDALPNDWEARHQLDPLLDDASGDADGDRQDNRSEFHAGTRPDDPDSNFSLVECSFDGSNVVVTWRGGTGVVQYVEHADHPGASGWKPVYTNTPPTPTTNVFTFTGPGSNGVYRVIVRP